MLLVNPPYLQWQDEWRQLTYQAIKLVAELEFVCLGVHFIC